MVPPLIQHTFTNKLEPRRKLQRLVPEHSLQILLRHKPRIADFVGIDVQVNIGFDEEDVVNYSVISFASSDTTLINLLSCSPHLPSLGDL